jgi:ribonuclease HI
VSLLRAFTDGSGTRSHLPCGAGVVVYEDDAIIIEASRPLGLGSNNHAELSAVRVALAITDGPEHRDKDIVIVTDSQYVMRVLTDVGAPVDRPNARLIALTRRSMRGRSVSFQHVRGHSGVEGNERADVLAGRARRSQLSPKDKSVAKETTP